MLCDGPCNRAFHEQCCTPRFVAAELDEEADWLCPACFTKVRSPMSGFNNGLSSSKFRE